MCNNLKLLLIAKLCRSNNYITTHDDLGILCGYSSMYYRERFNLFLVTPSLKYINDGAVYDVLTDPLSYTFSNYVFELQTACYTIVIVILTMS